MGQIHEKTGKTDSTRRRIITAAVLGPLLAATSRNLLGAEGAGINGATSKFATVNSIRMRYFEMGKGPLVILCHGFPESAYSWRHQIQVLAAAGYRVIAPDLRGYGETDSPKQIDAYTILQLVADLEGLLDAAGEKSCALIGHDFGAVLAWNAVLLKPDRFTCIAALSVPYSPRRDVPPVVSMRRLAGDKFFYIVHFQEPGVADAEMDAQPEKHLRAFYHTYSLEGEKDRLQLRPISRNSRLLDTLVDPGRLPTWLTPQDFAVYAADFKRNGFTGPLNWYRNLDRNWELMAPYAGAKITVPAVMISGDRDPVRPQTQTNYNELEANVPKLAGKVVIPNCGHWTQQEKPVEVNAAVLDFLRVNLPV